MVPDSDKTRYAEPLESRVIPEEMGVKGDKKKQSLYFPVEMLSEMQEEADRQERPLSWIMQQAWKLSRDKIRDYPSVDDM